MSTDKQCLSCGNDHRYRNWHLNSPAISWSTLARTKICLSFFNPSTVIYSTKSKLNQRAYSLALGLAKRLASSCNLNALVLVNLIKRFKHGSLTQGASISLLFTGQINIIIGVCDNRMKYSFMPSICETTRVNSRCVGTLTTCS